jgi:hypothetical protein
MAFTLLQVGGSLKSVNSTGGLSSALTLPSGITLATNRVPRFTKFKHFVVVVNTPTQPISVDDEGTARLLVPAPPVTPVVLSAGASGTLTGTYLALQTYLLRDSLGNVIAESDYGPAMSTSVAITNKKLNAAFGVSSQSVDATRLYRTATLGATYFKWVDVDGNTLTSTENDSSDASLSIIERPALGSVPDLTLVAEWAGRLWGVDRDDVDDLRFTEAGTMYAWSALNTLPIPHVGSDAAGITALIPRRQALGVTRRDMFLQITGSQLSNFAPVVVSGGEQLGCVSQESVVVYNDIAYFLWRDGVYTWDSTGINSITNGKVRSWFTSDLYFNKAMFWRAFAQLDPLRLRYRLFLASVGSSVVDRWIEYDLSTGAWFGPHKTDAFTPTSAVLIAGTDQQPYFMIGTQEGYLSQEQDDKNDWGIAPIAFSASTVRSDINEPDYEKYFGEVSVNGKAAASIVTVTPSVGGIDNATAGIPFSYNMANGRQRLGRIGVGKQASLLFENNIINQDVTLYGYEINPVRVVGRR